MNQPSVSTAERLDRSKGCVPTTPSNNTTTQGQAPQGRHVSRSPAASAVIPQGHSQDPVMPVMATIPNLRLPTNP